jgi:hypothetical protein
MKPVHEPDCRPSCISTSTPVFQDSEHVSRWIGENLRNKKRLERPRSAFDLRPVLLPLALMIVVLGLLAAVVPRFDPARLPVISHPLIDRR